MQLKEKNKDDHQNYKAAAIKSKHFVTYFAADVSLKDTGVAGAAEPDGGLHDGCGSGGDVTYEETWPAGSVHRAVRQTTHSLRGLLHGLFACVPANARWSWRVEGSRLSTRLCSGLRSEDNFAW